MKSLIYSAIMVLACVAAVAPTVWSDSTAELIKQLKHSNPEVRIQAATELGSGPDKPASAVAPLKELRRVGLIRVEKKGRYTECRVDGDAVMLLADLLTGRLSIEGQCENSPQAMVFEE